jgi:hypothetical protein
VKGLLSRILSHHAKPKPIDDLMWPPMGDLGVDRSVAGKLADTLLESRQPMPVQTEKARQRVPEPRPRSYRRSLSTSALQRMRKTDALSFHAPFINFIDGWLSTVVGWIDGRRSNTAPERPRPVGNLPTGWEGDQPGGQRAPNDAGPAASLRRARASELTKARSSANVNYVY